MPRQTPLLEAHEDNLDEAYKLAVAERFLHQDYIYLVVEPKGKIGKHINLWEDSIGEVVGRKFYDDPDFGDTDYEEKTVQPDLIQRRTTQALIVRMRIADVMEAVRRRARNEIREEQAPITANQMRGNGRANLAR